MRSLALFLLLAAVPCPAWAQSEHAPDDFPAYDVEARCQKHFRGNEGICISAEQRDYDLARLLWGNLSPGQKAKCASLARGTGPRLYAAVSGCVTVETQLNDLQRQQATTKFRY